MKEAIPEPRAIPSRRNEHIPSAATTPALRGQADRRKASRDLIEPTEAPEATLPRASQGESNEDGFILVEDETLRHGFTQIPNAILRRPDIAPGAKLTYMVLLSYAWQKGHCFPGQETMACDLGVSKRSVVTYLAQLAELGLLRVKRRGLGKTNLYILPKVTTAPKVAPPTKAATPKATARLTPIDTRATASEREETASLSSAEFAHQGSVGVGHPTSTGSPRARVAKSALPEGMKDASLEAKKLRREQYPEKNTQNREYEGTITRLASQTINIETQDVGRNAWDEREADIIASYLEDFAREFSDRSPFASTLGRALNLYRDFNLVTHNLAAALAERGASEAGSSEDDAETRLEEFLRLMLSARLTTKRNLGRVQSDRIDGRPKPAMHYFFGVLENRIQEID